MWTYFHLEPSGRVGLYVIVDEDGVTLTEHDEPILVVDEGEAEDILEELDIRGSIQ